MTENALGSTPLLSGFPFTTGAECLTAIRDKLVDCGWSIANDAIATTLEILMRGETSNGHFCWVGFKVVIEATREYIAVWGDFDGTGTALSPELEFNFTLGYTNRLWLMADNDSAGFVIRDRFEYQGGASVGFLERFDQSDQTAWMVAKANNRLNDAYIAQSHLGTKWARIGDSYHNADIFSSASITGAYQGILDFVTALPFGAFTARTIANAGFFAQDGNLNGVNARSLITRRFYLEGNENPDNYDDNTTFECRGWIKHFYNGFGSLPGGATFPDTSGNTYISAGAEGWQALRVVDSQLAIAQATDALPTIYHGITVLEQNNSDRVLAELKSALTSVGWVSLSDEVADTGIRTLVLQGQYFTAEEYCYLNLKGYSTGIVEIAAEYRDTPASEATLSPKETFANITSIQLSANAQAGAMRVFANSEIVPLFFGFYGGRIDPTDKDAWGFGRVGTDLNQFYVSRSRLTNQIWQSIGEQFDTNLDERSSFPANGIGDRLGVPLYPLSFHNNPDPKNPARKLNANSGKPDFLAIIEGRANRLDYGSIDPLSDVGFELYCRGYIQFCCVGGTATTETGASFVEGVQVS